MLKTLLADEPKLQVYIDAVKSMSDPQLLDLSDLIPMGDKNKVIDFILENKKMRLL